MKIDSINNNNIYDKKVESIKEDISFEDIVKSQIKKLDELQVKSDNSINSVIK